MAFMYLTFTTKSTITFTCYIRTPWKYHIWHSHLCLHYWTLKKCSFLALSQHHKNTVLFFCGVLCPHRWKHKHHNDHKMYQELVQRSLQNFKKKNVVIPVSSQRNTKLSHWNTQTILHERFCSHHYVGMINSNINGRQILHVEQYSTLEHVAVSTTPQMLVPSDVTVNNTRVVPQHSCPTASLLH